MVRKPTKADACHNCKGEGHVKTLKDGSLVEVDCDECGGTGEKPRRKKKAK